MDIKTKNLILLTLVILGFMLLIYLNDRNTRLNEVEQTTNTNTAIKYQPNIHEEIAEKINTELEPDAAFIMQKLIDPLKDAPGTVLETNNVRVDYIPSAKAFTVEILTIEYEEAKQFIFNWFLSHGFSYDEVCGMPITFYLNSEVKEELEKRGIRIVFNPVLSNCE